MQNTPIAIDTTISRSDKLNLNQLNCWLVDKDNEFIPSKPTIEQLPPGKYKIIWNNQYGCYSFLKENLNLDELLELPNESFTEILSDIKYFWENKELFDKYRFTYKRGILLHGNPGCGKSSILALVSDIVINKGGIVLSILNYDDLLNYNRELSKFRIIQPNTPLLVLFEDLDALLLHSESETLLLNILDGLNQSNNIVNIGCTNYPEKLKERVLNRPSRFDKRYYIGLPNACVREFYLKHKILSKDLQKFGGEEFITTLVKQTEGLTLAHLGELIKSVFIFNNTVEDSLNVLKDMSKTITSKHGGGICSIGFQK